MKNVTIKKDDKNVICTFINEAGVEETKIVPIYDANGKYNPELKEILNLSKSLKKEEASVELEETEDLEDNLDDGVIETKKHKVVNETEGKDGWLSKANSFLAGGIAVVTIATIILACRSCGKEDRMDAPIVTPNTIESSSTTLEDLQNDSRYTEITEEMLVQATQDLMEEYAKHGIELNGEDALTFVTIANITHLEETNQELLNKVLGTNPDAEETLTKVGHIIGQVVTLEVANKDEQADWTIALLDETDKKIANHNMTSVIVAAKQIAANKEMTEAEKTTAIQTLIQSNYVKPNYDKTVGYDFADGTHSALSQEDGADFINDAVITGILMGDNVLKNYVYGSETFDDIRAISYNEDVVSNIMRMVEECQNVDVQEETTSYVR